MYTTIDTPKLLIAGYAAVSISDDYGLCLYAEYLNDAITETQKIEDIIFSIINNLYHRSPHKDHAKLESIHKSVLHLMSLYAASVDDVDHRSKKLHLTTSPDGEDGETLSKLDERKDKLKTNYNLMSAYIDDFFK